MSAGKAIVLGLGFVAAIALGIAIGATMDDKWPRWTNSSTTTAQSTATPATEPAPQPQVQKRTARPAATAARREVAAKAKPVGAVSSVTVSVWEPELRDRVKSILKPGTKIELAAEDFDSAEQFMTVAHAARNTSVPFVLLKHRVLNEKQALADAIHESKPELDAKAEAERAKAAAKADLAA